MADLIWRSASTGRPLLADERRALIGRGLLLADFSWSVIATVDLNGDGKADLMWFNAGAGQTSTG